MTAPPQRCAGAVYASRQSHLASFVSQTGVFPLHSASKLKILGILY